MQKEQGNPDKKTARLISVDKALKEAIEVAGGMRSLGRKLGIRHQAISQWDRCPATRVLELERLTGIARETLRPDMYPPEDRK